MMPPPVVRLLYTRDEAGYSVSDVHRGYFAGGPTLDELRARVAESAAAEGWSRWILAPGALVSWSENGVLS